MSNQTKNLYGYHILNANKCHLDKDYSYLHTQLGHLANKVDMGQIAFDDFTKNALDAINKSNAFVQCDRICLSLIHPNSKTIKVFSSANSSNLKENKMAKNYSCMVRERSSIMSTLKSDMRIYADINDIIKSYEGKPTQRSLRYLAEMGVRSGVTIPLSEFGLHSGLLFLNSAEVGAFNDLRPEDYTILCLLKIIANNILFRKVHSIASMDQLLVEIMKDLEESNFFQADRFAETLKQVISQRFDGHFNLSVKFSKDIPEILFNDLPLCYLIARTLEVSLLKAQVDISINVSYVSGPSSNHLRFDCDGVDLTPSQSKLIQSMSFLPGQKFEFGNKKVSFINDVDLVVENLDYST